jgi:lysyl-tRNA synthetase class 2
MTDADFRYTAKIDCLKKRAEILKKIRAFFDARQVIEVETPLLAEAPVTDPHIEAIQTIGIEGYLQTSPEYAMKRLLAMGIGSCFQLCKAFRLDPHSRIHHPEFTMLEWYRLDFDDHALMDETEALLQTILSCSPAIRMTYEEAFQRFLHLSALESPSERLKDLFIAKFGPIPGSDSFTIDDWRMLLFNHGIEPFLTGDSPYFIYDFPASQAALARLKNDSVAARFEVYMNGIELANGYHELLDPQGQAARFESDLAQRKKLGKLKVPVDNRLLSALSHGLPDCAGIALGVDRLVMLALNTSRIQEVAVLA